MWENPSTQRNITQLKEDGVSILGPDTGEQACGEIGLGRMLEAEDLHALVNAHLSDKPLKNRKIIVTAGATLEMIDPVRAITNLSSGKMGYALAQAAFEMGADVTLISGSTTVKPPLGVKNISAASAESMYQAVMQNVAQQDIFIGVAAVADYSPASKSIQKIKKSEQTLTLELSKNKDILAEVASLPNAPFCVGFAAESEKLLEYAENKRKAKKLPLIVANLATSAMGSDENQVTLLDNNGTHSLANAPKLEVARAILQHISTMLLAR
jgi:phosphopantothenoylcysteine decarboxylase/phosphopantothenate--cysteine ligase